MEWIYIELSQPLEALYIVKEGELTHGKLSTKQFRWLIKLDIQHCLRQKKRLMLPSGNHKPFKICFNVTVQVNIIYWMKPLPLTSAISVWGKVGNCSFVKFRGYKKSWLLLPLRNYETKGTNFMFTPHTEVSAAEVEVLPVPDLTDLPSCNLMRQHAVQLSSLVKLAR